MTNAIRRTLVLIAIISLAAVGLALISQYMFDMQPCAYCVLQRMIYLAIAIVCLVTAAGGPALNRIGAVLAALLAIAGIWTAWYQDTVASHMLSCARTFADRFVTGSGLDAAVPSVFGVYATCAEARVSVFGLDYAVWSMILFVILLILAMRAMLRRA
jgi:disulfide bond formation protein DsbB